MKKLSTYSPKLMVTRILLTFTILFFTGIINAQSPTITLLGNNPFKHQVNTPFIDPGATAVDANGTDISSSITMSGLLNVTNLGTYTLSYKATDNNNNTTTITRTVIVTDLIPCLLQSKPGTALMNVALNDLTFVEPMVTGTDNYFSTVQITRNNGGFDIAKLGAYNITYTGVDPAGNTCTYVRTVIVGQTAGITEAASANGLSVYPNPAETYIEVEAKATGGTITITDITGKILINDIVESNKKQINVSSLATGVYFVNLMLNGTQTPVVVSKFVKK